MAAYHWLVYVFPAARLIDFTIGIFLFKTLCEYDKKKWAGPVGIILELFCLALVIFIDDEFFSSVAWVIPSCLIIYSLYFRKNERARALIWLGNISMELFLLHQLAIRYTSAMFYHFMNIRNSVMIAAVAFAFSVAAAIIWKKITNFFTEVKGNE